MPLHHSYKILFLPKWYPNRTDKFNGIFVEQHAKGIAEKCQTAVLYVGADANLQNKFDVEVGVEGKLKVVRVYYSNTNLGNSIFSKLIKLSRYLRASYKGLKIIKAEFGKPNLVHVNVLTRPGLVALLLKKLNHIPYLVTEHWSGYMPSDGSYKGFLKKYFTKLIVKNADAITTVSQLLTKSMQAHGLEGKYVTIENSIDLGTISNHKLSEVPNLLMIGNLEDREKNISPVIEAVVKLKSKIPTLQLTLIGDGVDKQKLMNLVDKLNASGFIHFTGNVPHQSVYEFLSASAFLIINSHFETFSVVAAEALACGTPVLTNQCGGPQEFISDEFGKIIQSNNTTELENGISWMCSNFNSFDKEKLQKFAFEKFNAEVISNKFLRLYDQSIFSWEAGNSREKINVPHTWSVLDVGSGDHPNERANVLLEREIEASEHRSGAVAVIPEGKKLVLGDATDMPFKDKEFDFVIASHIAEHIDNPEKFCEELQRVAKRGYLETPDAFSEFIFNEAFHLWVVSNKNGVLVFTEKTKHKVFSEWFYRFYYLNEKRTNHEGMYSNSVFVITFVNGLRRIWKYLPRTYTRFHWENKFEYKVIRKPKHG